MRIRKILLAITFAFACKANCRDKVFVDINRLVAFHPAFQVAERISKERPKTEPVLLAISLHLTGVQSQFKLAVSDEIRSWVEKQMKAWEKELELLRQHRLKIAGWQLRLALPILPLIDPYSRWEFIVKQKERQLAERVRLNLRLSFPELLTPEEKSALEQRVRELDAASEPSPSIHTMPLPLEVPQEKFDLPSPQPLTDPSKILALVAQPSPTSLQTYEINLVTNEFLPEPKVREAPTRTLKLMAHEFARSFVLAYAKKRGWKVTFKRETSVPDVTDEVLREWWRWLKRFLTEE